MQEMNDSDREKAAVEKYIRAWDKIKRYVQLDKRSTTYGCLTMLIAGGVFVIAEKVLGQSAVGVYIHVFAAVAFFALFAGIPFSLFCCEKARRILCPRCGVPFLKGLEWDVNWHFSLISWRCKNCDLGFSDIE